MEHFLYTPQKITKDPDLIQIRKSVELFLGTPPKKLPFPRTLSLLKQQKTKPCGEMGSLLVGGGQASWVGLGLGLGWIPAGGLVGGVEVSYAETNICPWGMNEKAYRLGVGTVGEPRTRAFERTPWAGDGKMFDK